MMDKPDRRIGKTRAAIFQAFSDLLREKSYTSITIQEIIDRANVGRTTFYQHFTDKDMLLVSCVESIFEGLSKHLSEQAPTEHDSNMIPVAEIFAHIRENSGLINGILLSGGGDLLFDKFRSYWGDKIEPVLLAHLPKGTRPEVPVEILVNHVTATMIELLRWWMKSGEEYSPEEMEGYFFALVLPSVMAAFGESAAVL